MHAAVRIAATLSLVALAPLGAQDGCDKLAAEIKRARRS